MRAAKLAILVLALIAGPSFSQPTGPPISGGGGAADPLTVLGPAAACADNQLARWNGASNTALQCSPLVVSDTTGDITAPGALTIATGGTGDLTLDLPSSSQAVRFPDARIILGTAPFEFTISQVSSGGRLDLTGYNGGIVFANSFTTQVGGGGFHARTTSFVAVQASMPFGWGASNGNGAVDDLSDLDVRLYRDAEGKLALRNGANAQTLLVYGTADTHPTLTNYERLSLSTTAGTGATIAVETDGTGADNLDLTIKPAGTGQLYVGAGGVTAASPVGAVVNATGGSGTDIAGASLTIAGGKGTGDAAGGSVVIQTSDPGASGTTLQTLATRVTVGVERTTIANILSLTGIAAAPSSPAAGDIVYDSVNNLFCGYNGSAWVSFSGAGTCWAE